MNNIKNLKQHLDNRKSLLAKELNDKDLENVLQLIDSNKMLQQYVERIKQLKFIQGMNQASIILFKESIEEL